MKDMNGRLASLDILKGFDLFMLLMFQPIFMQWLSIKRSCMEWCDAAIRTYEWAYIILWLPMCTSCRCISYNTLDV